MVYRSSRRPPNNEEEATRLEETNSYDSKDSDKDVKFSQNVAMWKKLCIFLVVLCFCLIVVIAVIASQNAKETTRVCGKGSNSVSRVIDLSEPKSPGPFHDLTKKEIKNIIAFLENDPSVKLKKREEATPGDAVVYTMDLLPAKKLEVNAYLAGKRSQPERRARTILFRADLNPPTVHELDCGPLPDVTECVMIKSQSRRNPVEYSLRPLFLPTEIENIEKYLLPKVDKQIGYILRESYGMSYAECKPNQCLRFFPAPMGSNVAGNAKDRKMWLSAFHPVEYYAGHTLGFGMMAHMDGSNPKDFYISKIWYNNQFFESVDDFIIKYNRSSLQKMKIWPGSMKPEDSFSSLFRRGEPLPETPQRPPTLVEPDGKRYSLKHREVDYLGWKFNFRMSTLYGPSLSNIRYKGEKIAHELSLAEISVIYSSNNPLQRLTDYSDGGSLLGMHCRSLVPGADCPESATFISQTFPNLVGSEPITVKRGFCLFENNLGYPLRRHLSYWQAEGAFYGGMEDSVLTLRSIQTVVNYDYVIDFIFHQNGAIQTRVMSTGYILPMFYHPTERPYGFQVHKNMSAPLHHHMFHFKADLDISGTSNRYETLDITPETIKLRDPPNHVYHQTRIERHLYKREKDALYKFNFDQPKYHLVHNEAKRTDLGEMKSYRLILNGMSKSFLRQDENNEPTLTWTQHQLVVTKQKDDEITSSSPYAMFDSLNPVTNFSKYYDDNEDIVDKDLVFWINMGIHHIPHSEDIPITPTVGGHLSFVLTPYNYFPTCPSFASRDHIRIQLKDVNNPDKGVKVDRNGNKDERCVKQQYATEYDQLLQREPDVVVEL